MFLSDSSGQTPRCLSKAPKAFPKGLPRVPPLAPPLLLLPRPPPQLAVTVPVAEAAGAAAAAVVTPAAAAVAPIPPAAAAFPGDAAGSALAAVAAAEEAKDLNAPATIRAQAAAPVAAESPQSCSGTAGIAQPPLCCSHPVLHSSNRQDRPRNLVPLKLTAL